MPPAAKTLFEKRVLDSQKLLLMFPIWPEGPKQKFLEFQEPFYKKVLGRRRHKNHLKTNGVIDIICYGDSDEN
jgi:hypothetical protein